MRIHNYTQGTYNLDTKLLTSNGTNNDTENFTIGDLIVEVSTLIDAAKGPWEKTTVNSVVFYLAKGSGNSAPTIEVGDKVIGDEGGQIIVATYLGGTVDDFSNPAVWDKNAIA